MKKIPLHTRSLDLPDCWEDLSRQDLLFVMKQLLAIKSGIISPSQARVFILKRIGHYQASVFHFRWLFISKGKKDEARVMIQYNFLRLSELINFIFRINQSTGTVFFNFTMKRNPLPILKIGNQDIPGKFFDIGTVIKTNITAQEFCDAFDAYKSLGSGNLEIENSCVNLICAILYPKSGSHAQNINSSYPDMMNKLNAVTQFTILFWFQSICEFLFHHPLYAILFRKTDEESEESKYSVGMDEIIMHLSLAGFDSMSNIQHITVIDFFDMQVASLRHNVRDAIAKGVAKEDLAKSMHLTYKQINELVE